MSREENERTKYRLYGVAEEAMKSIQQYAALLKNPEDSVKNIVTVMKMQDSIADMRNAYSEIERIEMEEYEEDQYDEWNNGDEVDEYTRNLLNPFSM